LDPHAGIGRVATVHNNRLEFYPIEPSTIWFPTYEWPARELEKLAAIQVLKFQLSIIGRQPKRGKLETDRWRIIKNQNQLSRHFLRHRIRLISSM
jgi:hypothetical protein